MSILTEPREGAEMPGPAASVGRIAPLLFFSGACALVYQVAWFRELRLIFGASTAASAAVLAVFMGGLGIGGAWLGRRADRSLRPLALYAHLELGVGLTAALTPTLVWLADAAYIASGGQGALGTALATLFRIALSVVVLGPPTFLMGGTLPAASRSIADVERRGVAALYGTNTLGAVAGAMLANFVLLEVFGTRLTLWVAALVNLLIGVIARSMSRRTRVEGIAEQAESVEREVPSAHRRWLAPAASAVAGAAFMLMELDWYRMLGPIIGGSSYTFGLVLAVALLGIGLGGAFYARRKMTPSLGALAATCVLEALFVAVPYVLGDRIALLAAFLRPLSLSGFGASVAVWTVVTSIVVLPAAFLSGIQFPLIIGLYGSGQSKIGQYVGQAYLANTLGSIFGSLAGGFGLIPLLGAVACWRLVVFVLVGFGVLVMVVERGRSYRLALAAVPVLAVLLSRGPTAVWRHGGIGAGRADADLRETDPLTVESFVRKCRRSLVWEEDGVESSVAVSKLGSAAFVVNGKVDGSAVLDAPTQVMGGMIPALLHPSPKRALVIGLGTGSTAGWLAAIPSMTRVEVAELEPSILRVARDFAAVNQSVMDNPKIAISIGDARELLRTSRGRYDIIFSEPSNPYRAGISSLYTTEFYRAAAKRLEADGIFAQWVQSYEIDASALATVAVTLKSVFPSVSTWQTTSGDLVFVAQMQKTPIDVARIRSRLQEPAYAEAARYAWRTTSAEGVLAHFVAGPGFVERIEKDGVGAVNTDDTNLLEFAFARKVGIHRQVDEEWRDAAIASRSDVPVTTGAFDSMRVIEERWFFTESEGGAPWPAPASIPYSTMGPLLDAYLAHDCLRVLREWNAAARPDPTFGELAIASECAGRVGTSAEDAALVERAPNALERIASRALFLGNRGDYDASVEQLALLFDALRRDPWMRRSTLIGAVNLAVNLAGRRDGQLARRLSEMLAGEFAVFSAFEERQRAAAVVVARTKDTVACRTMLLPLEPPPPRDRELLEIRAGCYGATSDARAPEAFRDLARLVEESAPLRSRYDGRKKP